MKGKIVLVAAALVAVVALGAAFAPGALAQTPGAGNGNGPATAQGNGPAANGNAYGPGMMGGGAGMRGGMMGGRGMMGGQGMMGSENSLIAVAANQLNMTADELVAALGGTKSIAQVAAEHNVSVDTIVNAFLAPRIEHLNDLVAAGRITQEQADQMVATMRTNVTTHINEVWTPRGNGPGQGTGFVDADGDGVCDNMPAGGQQGQGMMGQNRGGRR